MELARRSATVSRMDEDEEFDRWFQVATMDESAQVDLVASVVSTVSLSDPLWREINIAIRRMNDLLRESRGTDDETDEIESEWLGLLVKCRARIQ